jgi:RND family efflux transporter MFP subunit
MSAQPEERPRADLSALRINRGDDEENYSSGGAWIRYVVWVLVLAALAAGAVYGYKTWIVPRRAPIVDTIVAKATVNVANPALLNATGYLVANKQSKITPKISGKVIELNIDTGMKVHKGDVIAVLESTNVQAQLDETNASLAEAQKEYTRQAAMWREGVTTHAQLDAAESQLKVAKARVDQIRINKQDMVIRAPFDGTIATKNTEVGEVISSVALGQVAGTLPAGAIATLVDLKTLEVETDINEQSLAQVHQGQPAEISVDAFPGQKWKGYLRQIIPTADRAKGIVKVKVSFINPSDRLLPEMAANVAFLQSERTDQELHEPPKLWLPTGAIVDSNGTKKVAVVNKESHIELRQVTAGEVREGRVEIRSGVREGDRIVTANPEKFEDGQLVRLPAEGK